MPNPVTIASTFTSNDLISGKRSVVILVEDPSGFAREITVLSTPIDVDLEIEGVHQCNAKAVLLTREQAVELGTVLLTPAVAASNLKAETRNGTLKSAYTQGCINGDVVCRGPRADAAVYKRSRNHGEHSEELSLGT